MSKILITGATGFIGSKVLHCLIKEYGTDSIVALASSEIKGIKTLPHNDYNFDSDYLVDENIDTIIHIGAFTPKNSSQINDIEKSFSNISNTKKLLSLNLPNLKRIIFTSTLDVYKNAEIITEKSSVEPISLYGYSKLYCEKMIEHFCKNKNILCQILRIGHVFGEGEEKYQKIIPITIQKIISNQQVEIWGDGKALRTFIYIEDVAKAIANAVKLEKSNLINIVGEETISVKNLVEKLIKISGKNIEIIYKNTDTPNRNLIFDNSKLKKLLLTKLVSLEEGLKREYLYVESKK